jgi:hypothetical protein
MMGYVIQYRVRDLNSTENPPKGESLNYGSTVRVMYDFLPEKESKELKADEDWVIIPESHIDKLAESVFFIPAAGDNISNLLEDVSTAFKTLEVDTLLWVDDLYWVLRDLGELCLCAWKIKNKKEGFANKVLEIITV